MIQVIFDNIELLPGESEDVLKEKISSRYDIPAGFPITILRRSLDARDKLRIVFRYRVLSEFPPELAQRLFRNQGVRAAAREEAPAPLECPKGLRVIIIGAGPAGLFCALRLLASGASVDIFERGRRIEERHVHVHQLVVSGTLDPESNVLFGEGGAGAYSDGKLTTRIHRPEVRWFFRMLVDVGAPSNILYEQRPHLGTDGLLPVIKAIRGRIESLGGRMHLNSRVSDFIIREERIHGVITASGEEHLSSAVVLACGHSARDVYDLCVRRGVTLEKKGFAVGVRVEHPAPMIDAIQYGESAGRLGLPPAEYALTHRGKTGERGVYSFCMCPGGEVINASSEEAMLNVNGMSYSRRDGRFSNAALVVAVEKDDLEEDALAGVRLQRHMESMAFTAGGGGFIAPAQRVTSFLSGKMDTTLPPSSYTPGVRPAMVTQYLPDWISREIGPALKSFDRKMKGFISDEGLLVGAETRSSSPVRIMRGADFQSVSVRCLYPVGEGAGYAGGIVSSAVDGIRAADMICGKRDGETVGSAVQR